MKNKQMDKLNIKRGTAVHYAIKTKNNNNNNNNT